MEARIKVGIYTATYTHYSLVNVILKSLNRHARCEFYLFIVEGMENMLEKENVKAVLHVDPAKFVPSSVFSTMQDMDFVIVDEIYSFRQLISFSLARLTIPRLLIVHGCNTWFNSKPVKKIKNKLKRFMTQRIRQKFAYFAVASWNMVNYVKEVLTIGNVTLIPFRYGDYDDKTDNPNVYITRHSIKIAIPGTISERRDYEGLINTLLCPDLKDKVELIFLGKPMEGYGDRIIKELKKKEKEGYQVKYWTSFIPDDVFDEEIRACDLLFSQFDVVYHTNNGQEEIYGLTKETGITLLMLNKAKPGLLPDNYRQISFMEGQTIKFNNFDDIAAHINSIFYGDLDLNKLAECALKNAQEMDLKWIADSIFETYKKQL